MFVIVSAGQLERNGFEFQCCDTQSFLLDSAENLAYVSAGNSIWLDQYKGALGHESRQ